MRYAELNGFPELLRWKFCFWYIFHLLNALIDKWHHLGKHSNFMTCLLLLIMFSRGSSICVCLSLLVLREASHWKNFRLGAGDLRCPLHNEATPQETSEDVYCSTSPENSPLKKKNKKNPQQQTADRAKSRRWLIRLLAARAVNREGGAQTGSMADVSR